MRKKSLIILFVFLLGATCATATPSVAEPFPAVTAAELDKYELTPAALADKIFGYALPQGPEKATASGDMLHRYARLYVHTGAPVNAETLLAKIGVIVSRTFLLEIYAGEMVEDIAAGRDDLVLERLNSLTPMYAHIEQVQNTPAPQNIENYRHEHIRGPARSFCLLAAKAYAEKGRLELLDKITAIPDCANDAATIARFRRQALLAQGNYAEALHLLAVTDPDGESYTPRGHSFEHVTKQKGAAEPNYASRSFIFEPDLAACLPGEDGTARAVDPAVKQQVLAAAAREPPAEADAVNFLLSRLLAAAGDFAAAEDAGMKISIPDIRNRAMMFLYEHYFLAGDEKGALRVATLVGMFSDAPLEVGGWGMRDPSQWYNVLVPGARVLQEKPGALALKLALAFDNPRTRFATLAGLAGRGLRAHDHSAFDGCADGLSCYTGPMATIATQEQDEAARDYMYARLSTFARAAGDVAGADAFAAKVAKPDRMVCHYDMCTNLLTPIRSATDCGKLIKDSGDKGVAILQELHQWTPGERLLSRYRDDGLNPLPPEDEKAAEKKEMEARMAAQAMAACHVSTGLYRDFIADPKPLGAVADDYFGIVAEMLVYQSNDYNGAVAAVAALSQPQDRYKMLAKQIGHATGENSGKTLDQLLAAIDAVPGLRHDYTLWWNLLDAVAQKPEMTFIGRVLDGEDGEGLYQYRLRVAEKILRDRPDIRAAFLKKPAYLVQNLCPLLVDALPGPAGISSWAARPREDREALFRSCPARLVEAGKYREALYLTDRLFSDPEMNYRIQLAALERMLQETSLPFRQATLRRSYSDSLGKFQFSEDGFEYLQAGRAAQSFTRSYESPYKCAIELKPAAAPK